MSVCLAPGRGQEVSVRVVTPAKAPNIQEQCLFFKPLDDRMFLCELSLYNLTSPCPTLQVTVKMYKRGSRGWLGKSLNATTTIPSNTSVIFRISGEEADAKIPANTIHSITLSNWQCASVNAEDSHHNMVPQGEEGMRRKYAENKPNHLFTECLLLCSVCILYIVLNMSSGCLYVSIYCKKKKILSGNIMLMKMISHN